ncbi:hypothetical protein TREMEDRAFT_44848 [Tremella mesenterica DSM 1558]|uniref:uncharacterized protein n=1 Tax=Tremella mesenterica (strain ATCC 24925 / CBS 8224 / DSM 1558 / NBRC 9311 / NRRL Y-6157 / RJB 2259-6 / UBC 559-6) TaxID=578456 RepID=UPI0003F497DC|nr:uncharacterized protein TREMEDRAFT_44848 [Tremella mesenterica DSM 1558]EIW67822.1 hypothetical protein TREMEDRAFT_44848 [Tremella mesenterica DSM 1558]
MTKVITKPQPIPHSFTLSNGVKVPAIGLGTWQSPPGEVAKAVEAALKCGYRHIDCAWGYGNEGEVGEGIRASGVPREEIFITSKLYELHHKKPHPEMALRDTLKKLGTDYLDLWLMHWNINFETDAPDGELPQMSHVRKHNDKIVIDVAIADDVSETWAEMERLQQAGLTKSIGVSNFNIYRIKKLLETAKIKPVVNQVELSLQCPQPELVEWLKKNDILPEAYSPLGSTAGKALRENPTVVEIAQKHDCQGAAVLISWLLMRGICPLPKSVTPERIEANLKTVQLSDDEFYALEKLAEDHPSKRVCDQTDDLHPRYDIFLESHPELSDKAQYAQELA